jgi:hypothetical protein
MNREEAFSIWAPGDSPWSPWSKAVLFSFMPDEIPDLANPPAAAWKVPLVRETALLVELPGESGVDAGIALAQSGYRPIPLYNACPWGLDDSGLSISPALPAKPINVPSVIDVEAILRALKRETGTLRAAALPPSAPPAFLLDAYRANAGFSPAMGWFDNRSVVRESDLPSAAYLMDRGIRQIVLVRAGRSLRSDLQAVLLSWQAGGLSIAEQTAMEDWKPEKFAVPRPSALTFWWNRLALRFGYRLNSAGAFGRFVRGSSGSSG